MPTKPIGKEFQPVVSKSGKVTLVKNDKIVEAKLDVSTRLQRRHKMQTRIRYGKKGIADG